MRHPWPRITSAVLILTALALEGCSILPSHLHNAEDAATAKRAQAELAAYDEAAPSMYQAMLTNLAKFKVEQDRVLADLAENRDRAQLTSVVLGLTSDNFATRQGDLSDTIRRLDTQIKDGVAAYFAKRKEALAAQADAKAAIEALKQRAERAKQDADRWSMAIALINKGLAAAPSNGKSSPTLTSNIAKLSTLSVEYRRSDGTQATATILEVLKESVQAGGPEGERFAALFSADGIDATITNLGLDLARVNQRIADAELAQLSRRADLYEDSHSAMELSKALIANLRAGVWDGSLNHDLIANGVEARRQYARVAEGASAQITSFTQPIETMTGRLTAIRRVVVADAILARAEQMLALESARLDHEDSIVRSRGADESWRALLRGGMSGLVAYHSGGFTAEDAANIIRIAQAIALAFIAGGVQ